MNRHVKRLAERALVVSGVVPFARSRHAGRVLVLAYHNIVPEGERVTGDGSLHLPQRRFAAQLDTIFRTHDVVPLRDALDARRASKRPAVAITFDDAYDGAMRAGVHELRRRGLPATVFVAPALLGATNWWDMLADPAGSALEETTRQYALDVLQGNRDAILAWAERTGVRVNASADVPRLATLSLLKSAMRESGIDVQSHSWSHRNLAALDRTELQSELVRPRQWLADECGRLPSLIAYPYGLHTPDVDRAASTAGYEAAFRVVGGWMAPPTSGPRAFALPRFNVPANLSLDGFRIRLAGIAASA